MYHRFSLIVQLPLVSILLSNLFPIIGVLFWGWNVVDLLFLYLIEIIIDIIILGLHAKRKGLKGSQNLSELRKYGDSENENRVFRRFVVHYAMITLVPLIGIIGISVVLQYVPGKALIIAIAGLLINSIVSYKHKLEVYSKNGQVSMKKLYTGASEKYSVFGIMFIMTILLIAFLPKETTDYLFLLQSHLESLILVFFVLAKIAMEVRLYLKDEKAQ